MYNFSFKPDCPDGSDSKEIAEKIRAAKSVRQNAMEFMLSKQLDTKDMIRVDLASITDFVRLEPEEIYKNITLGTFQLRLSKSYIGDLLKHGTAFVVSPDYMKKTVKKTLPSVSANSKIVAVEIVSRHRRSQIPAGADSDSKKFKNIYKIFVHYDAFGANSTAIKSNSYLLRYQSIENYFNSNMFKTISAAA